MVLVLYRSYFDEGVNGILIYNGKFICNTIELPWKNNKKRVSCIPEGTYYLKLRYNKQFGNHLMVSNVPGRTWILIHPANDAQKELRGCIAPVSKLIDKGKGIFSRRAMDVLMRTVQHITKKNELTHLKDRQVKLIIKKGNYEISRST